MSTHKKIHASLSICPGCGANYALPVGQLYCCTCGTWLVGGSKTSRYWFNWAVFLAFTVPVLGVALFALARLLIR